MIKIIIIKYLMTESDKEKILQEFKNKNLSMRQVAKELNISVAYLSDLLKGNRYVNEVLIAKFKGIGIDLMQI